MSITAIEPTTGQVGVAFPSAQSVTSTNAAVKRRSALHPHNMREVRTYPSAAQNIRT
jgi:hypothetical protein